MNTRFLKGFRLLLLALCLGLSNSLLGQLAGPLEIREPGTPYNRLSRGGPPRPPTSQQQEAAGLTTAPPTQRQFTGWISYGGVAAPQPARRIGNAPAEGTPVPGDGFGQQAFALGLPLVRSAGDGSEVQVVLRRATVGAPFNNRRLDFRYGSVIPVPSTDADGRLLAPGAAEDYWLAEPFAADGQHHSSDYYWSPHARKVFAARAGPIEIIWKRREPEPGAINGPPENYHVVAGRHFRLLRVRYVVSSSPVRSPRTIYWTEGKFAPIGKMIEVPAARIGDIHVVYSGQVPAQVTTPFEGGNDFGFQGLDENSVLPVETRTLWYDRTRGLIRAYNAEGRVLVEILGDPKSDGITREPLGMEIVQIVKQPSPIGVTNELGARLTAFDPALQRDDSHLQPWEILNSIQAGYTFRHVPGGQDVQHLYATRETVYLNDLWVHWLEEGVAGLRWPLHTVRYSLEWPRSLRGPDWSQGGAEVAKYSHYIRPPASDDAEAATTAVPLPIRNAGQIAWQDALPLSAAGEPLGARITPDQKFYTYLDTNHPVHRTLLRFTSADQVAFERVLSWLSPSLVLQDQLQAAAGTGAIVGPAPLAGSVVTNLTEWNWGQRRLDLGRTPGSSPRVLRETVEVGSRIHPPADEPAVDPRAVYWAGHIRREVGRDFDASAYLDPFEVGFSEANRGAILPVNARPSPLNRLEVWWFRANGFANRPGFDTIYWPSVIGRYSIRWPQQPREIVLASNQGSGGLGSLEANGTIYVQNFRELDGYNPNEEHALMLGGQAYALRDDLNLFGSGTGAATYTSEPFVLLRYTAADGRPAMTPFRVLREKPEAGWVFDYPVNAGTILQAPMPLPLLERPLVRRDVGEPERSLNQQLGFVDVSTPVTGERSPWQATVISVAEHFFRPSDYQVLERMSGDSMEGRGFYITGVQYAQKQVTGIPLDISRPPLRVRSTGPFFREGAGGQPEAVPNSLRFVVTDDGPLDGPEEGDAVVLLPTGSTPPLWDATVLVMDTRGREIAVQFASPGLAESAQQAAVLLRPLATRPNFAQGGWRLGSSWLNPAAPAGPGEREFLSGLTLQDRKGNVWVYRGAHEAADPASFRMQFYYRTLPDFYFPQLEPSAQPPVGTVTPYLRNLLVPGTRNYHGDAVRGDADSDREGDGNPLWITYRAQWPPDAPVLQRAETLAHPKRGLPAVRGQSSLRVAYQQSQVLGGRDRSSVVLHDATREKEFRLGAPDNGTRLDALPDSVHQQTYRGRSYFPNLPPHLAERFFLDPNRGDGDGFRTFGALVFHGRFVDEALGEDYLHLNVLSQADRRSMKGLCLPEDPRKGHWDAAVEGMATVLERFHESPARPGTFVVDTGWNPDGDSVPGQRVGIGDLAALDDDEIAVDSYALTAVGPDTGYVTLIAGNGLAFTPPEEPVSVQVLRVVDRLYPGELKVIESPNPLAEKVSLQQVVDLAGQTDAYLFEWRIASPVDGLPPLVYQNVHEVLLNSGEVWEHLEYPLPSDFPGQVHNFRSGLRTSGVRSGVVPNRSLPLEPSATERDGLTLRVRLRILNDAALLRPGNRVVLGEATGLERHGIVTAADATGAVRVTLDPTAAELPDTFRPSRLFESPGTGPSSIVVRALDLPATASLGSFWLSMNLDAQLGVRVHVNGAPVVTANLGDGDTAPQSPPSAFRPLSKAYRLNPAVFAGGTVHPTDPSLIRHQVSVELFSQARPDVAQAFDLKLEGYRLTDVTGVRTDWLGRDAPDGVRMVLGETADVRSLSDNYVIMRYALRPDASGTTHWSAWTEPQLVEGYIKRVLKGINPFNQRVKDLFENRVNTDASILSQAGTRWEGDVALNLDQINNYGLIEIYETVLRRGRMLSIDAGINFGPANDALLLAAGYLNDLYVMVGNEAAADAANPTIGIGTKDRTYGDIATALFAFKGQVASLLDEELALLRGRDDFLQPGVTVAPVYNRLIWNYTRGIDSGEVIYALNYNIQENNDTGVNGTVDADDARRMFPQGHGDAYGHYLTAAKGYYSLLMDTDFDWIPRTEAVLVLGKPVQVDYSDERKFAAAAVALARTGRQIFDLTWRQQHTGSGDSGWRDYGSTRSNTRRPLPTTRFWGLDHWASRTQQGAYINWVLGNTLLPEEDPDPDHEGIQRIDRRTVPELRELASIAGDLQSALDQADARLSPLGLPAGSLAFDINPNLVAGAEPQTHFEQVYARARVALRNAVTAFDDAKDVTRLMRSESDALAEFQAQVASEETAYQTRLTELYGSPYPDDVGPGRTYPTGYAGEDRFHFMYVDNVELTYGKLGDGYGLQPREPAVFTLDYQPYPDDWADRLFKEPGIVEVDTRPNTNAYAANPHHIKFTLPSHGFFGKPESWRSRRETPGRIQQSISDIIKARNQLAAALNNADGAKDDVDKAVQLLNHRLETKREIRRHQESFIRARQALESVRVADEITRATIGAAKGNVETSTENAFDGATTLLIAGVAAGTDNKFLKIPVGVAKAIAHGIADAAMISSLSVTKSLEASTEAAQRWGEFNEIATRELDLELRASVAAIGDLLWKQHAALFGINQRLQELEDAQRRYRGLLAEGDRIRDERQVFRQRAAAVIQGFRTRDAAFRIFRNEKLERYKSLFDLAARYALLAANAYDYETGLLNTGAGRDFVRRIIGSRALGVVTGGEPQFAGSNTGDPGLSSALAEMKADWDVLKGRLGFNNPDAYGTTASLRTGHFRLPAGAGGDAAWRDFLQRGRTDNLLRDPDVRRYCLQIQSREDLPVPGLVLEFSTTIAPGYNLFGRQLAAGDHAFSPTAFATKIHAAGVALDGYVGMEAPAGNRASVSFAGGTSPAEPSLAFLDPTGLSATPYVYLVPVGQDSMRTPPLGDASDIRTWSVDDVTIPLPFNIGASDRSTPALWQSSSSLSEPMFGIRKHPAFRPVANASQFPNTIFNGVGGLAPSQYTSRRLIGRSVWNSRWKLVIPGSTLLHNPEEGLDRFIRTVRDIQVHFVTYSYSGN